ncbi:phosphopantetheinyl transferase (holo-ACP synthase) [Geomicrobium halophilum]|uniref:Phosphopantetheinyl transferase (Holo-ACP synthase) n=1 Tax=Geomicrobium halophilum TaxID=549000 RepID=A0A841PU76_9BACL|nr:hypothetical protein [Geomicrobium halophilum]MBB6450706.1 phosphopantetheinyl transferase (holo-ACP synthase) [Geomicrobium halophilum]
MMEDKLTKFERIAKRRTEETVKKIRLIGNLSNKNNYEYTEEHLDKIFAALEAELKSARRKFQGHSSSPEFQMSFETRRGRKKTS